MQRQILNPAAGALWHSEPNTVGAAATAATKQLKQPGDASLRCSLGKSQNRGMSAARMVGLAAVLCALGHHPLAKAAITVSSYWRMGENDPGVAAGVATNTTDPTGLRTMTLKGPAAYDAGVSPAAATVIGSAWCISFSTGAYGTNGLIPSLTNNFGIELWVKPNDTTGSKCLAYNGNTVNSGWGLYQVGATYQILFGGVTFIGSGAATAGTWTHLAFVRNNGTNILYLDGLAGA